MALQMVKGQERLALLEGAPLTSSHTTDYGKGPGMEQNDFMGFEGKLDFHTKQQGEI